MKIFLHVCCGPCSTAVIEQLKEEGYELVLFFPNSNIFPKEEWEKRLENAKKIAKLHGLKLIVDDYDHSAWREFVKGLESEPEGGARCEKCFEFNLTRTAEKARELGIDNITTTLTVSRHKNSKRIFEVAQKIASEYKLNFVDVDFKKKCGYEKSVELSRKIGLHRQDYCGCEFSKRDN
ncbi:MAG: epoxyqueuosine reductase QueH [Nanoarchaeota archaeon]